MNFYFYHWGDVKVNNFSGSDAAAEKGPSGEHGCKTAVPSSNGSRSRDRTLIGC
jgi:hypothetical protein